MLEELCHALDLELEDQSSFPLYCQEFQRFQLYEVHLAKQSEAVGHFHGYGHWKVTVDLLHKLNNMSRKYSKGAEFNMHT